MTDYKNFFDAKPVVQEQQETVITEFRPSPKKGLNGVYKAVVRFLPNPDDPANKSIISKYVAYIKDPKNPLSSVMVDCPSTVGAPDSIQNTFFALRASSNPVLQENSKMFSRKQQFVSLIQVLSCEAAPQLVNRILVWKYGIKIYEKINAEMNPPMGEGHNPFNILSGRPFSVNVKEVSGYPNYDNCNFFDLDAAQSGMRVSSTNAQGQPQLYVVTADTISSDQGKALVFNYLKDNAPDTTKYEYHAWDADTTDFVNSCIQIYSNPQATVQLMSAAQNPGGAIQSAPQAAQAAAMPQIQMPNMSGFGPSENNMGLGGGFNAPAAPAAPAMPQMPSMGLGTPSVAPATTPGGFDAPQLSPDVNDLLNNAAPKKTSTAAPAMGLDLSDVLNGQIIGQ